MPYAHGLRLLAASSYDLHVPPDVAQFRLDLRLVAGRLKRFIGNRFSLAIPAVVVRVAIRAGELIFISALMQAGLAILMAYHFHRATTTGMLANLAVIPLTQLLMPAAAAAVGLGYFSTSLALPAVWVSRIALQGIAGTVHKIGGSQLIGTTIADLRVAMPSASTMILTIAILMLAMLAARRSRWAAFFSVGLLFTAAVWISFVHSSPHLRPGMMEMTAIDVGQGDSILLITPKDARCLSTPAACRFG